MNQRKTLEIVLANVKVLERKREKVFVQEIKIFQQKNNSIPTNSSPTLSRTSSLTHTKQIIEVTHTLDDNSTPSFA